MSPSESSPSSLPQAYRNLSLTSLRRPAWRIPSRSSYHELARYCPCRDPDAKEMLASRATIIVCGCAGALS